MSTSDIDAMSAEQRNEQAALNYSTAHRLITQSPLHAWHAHPVLNPDYRAEESDAMDAGAIAHKILLGKGADIVQIEAPDWRTKAAKEQRDAVRAERKLPILAHKMRPIEDMVHAARCALSSFAEVEIVLNEGDAERSLYWKEGDALCRATPDWRHDSYAILLDYKSTAGSAEPSAWIRSQMHPMGYDLQGAFQLRGNHKNGGPIPERTTFMFLVQENYPPYACSFVGLSPALYEIAERKMDFAVQLWRQCMAKNTWNGYPQRVAYAEPPAWVMAEDEARQQEGA